MTIYISSVTLYFTIYPTLRQRKRTTKEGAGALFLSLFFSCSPAAAAAVAGRVVDLAAADPAGRSGPAAGSAGSEPAGSAPGSDAGRAGSADCAASTSPAR